jgi:uroporphyrinogen-III synthase
MPAIVLTRPTGQNHTLSDLLREELPELDQIQLPLLSIVPNQDPAEGAKLKELMNLADLAIFVSPNAIECGMRLLGSEWPKNLPIAVIGGGSAEALERRGITIEQGYQIDYPKSSQHWDSEGLWDQLNSKKTSWANKEILFLKGSGGREWLGQQFLDQGAKIHQVMTYRRIPLNIEAPNWELLRQQPPEKTAFLLNSSEAVRHLSEVLHQPALWSQSWIDSVTLICSHERIAETAQGVGFKQVECCLPGNEYALLAIQNWLKSIS